MTESVQRAVEIAGERCGTLRLAVNSAYSAMVGSFLETPADLFAMTTNATLNGTYRSMQAEAKAMRAAGGGSIVNISSVAAARQRSVGVGVLGVESGRRHAHACRR